MIQVTFLQLSSLPVDFFIRGWLSKLDQQSGVVRESSEVKCACQYDQNILMEGCTWHKVEATAKMTTLENVWFQLEVTLCACMYNVVTKSYESQV